MVNPPKQKGNQFEYDCQHNLEQVYIGRPVYRTAERGYQLQFDLRIDCPNGYIAVECKREKGFTWNRLKQFFQKLEIKASDAKEHKLLFKGNRQPPLVMFRNKDKDITVQEFKDHFKQDFEERKK